jgi:hypothetical protein
MYLEFTTVITFQSTQNNNFTSCMCECVLCVCVHAETWKVLPKWFTFPKLSGSRSHFSLHNFFIARQLPVHIQPWHNHRRKDHGSKMIIIIIIIICHYYYYLKTEVVESVSEIHCRCWKNRPLKGTTGDTPLGYSE